MGKKINSSNRVGSIYALTCATQNKYNLMGNKDFYHEIHNLFKLSLKNAKRDVIGDMINATNDGHNIRHREQNKIDAIVEAYANIKGAPAKIAKTEAKRGARKGQTENEKIIAQIENLQAQLSAPKKKKWESTRSGVIEDIKRRTEKNDHSEYVELINLYWDMPLKQALSKLWKMEQELNPHTRNKWPAIYLRSACWRIVYANKWAKDKRVNASNQPSGRVTKKAKKEDKKNIQEQLMLELATALESDAKTKNANLTKIMTKFLTTTKKVA